MSTFPKTAQEALIQLQAIPTIKDDYSAFRLDRLFHYDPYCLEGYSVTEKQWVVLWYPELID